MLSDASVVPSSLELFLDGQYEKILESNEIAVSLFAAEPGQNGKSFSSFVIENLESLMLKAVDDSASRYS